MNFINRFHDFCIKPIFWLVGAAYLLLMISIALYYQYILDVYPCALCVQIRAWIMGAILLSIFTSFFCKKFWWRWAGLTLTTALIVGALYTSWYSLMIERGEIISSCTVDAGFPKFMPLDQWIPPLFAAEGICGKSPDMWFGLTMNEGLIITVGVPALVLLALWFLHFRELLLSRKRV